MPSAASTRTRSTVPGTSGVAGMRTVPSMSSACTGGDADAVLLVATRNFGKGLRNFRLNKLVPADVTELPKGFKLPEGTSPAHSARIAKCLHSMLKGGEVRLREVDPMTLSDAAANPKHHRSKNRRPSTSSAARKKTTAGKAGSKGRLGRLGRGRGRSHAPCPRRPRGAFPLFVSAS